MIESRQSYCKESRVQFFGAHCIIISLRDLFETVDNRVIIDFIKDIRWYSLLQYLFVPFS